MFDITLQKIICCFLAIHNYQVIQKTAKSENLIFESNINNYFFFFDLACNLVFFLLDSQLFRPR